MTTSSIERIPSASTDVFAIYSQEGNGLRQVFRLARPMKAEIIMKSKAMEQPLETGATIVDHRIILPIEIEIDLFLSSSTYNTTIDQIKQSYVNGSSLVVHARSGIYGNLFIQDMPHEEKVDKFDAITVRMKLKEALFVTSSFQPVNITNRDTVSRGNISTIPANTDQRDQAQKIYDKASTFFD